MLDAAFTQKSIMFRRGVPTSKITNRLLFRANHFNILGVNENSSVQDIKAAFRKKAMELHPDKFQSANKREVELAHENFVKLRGAYEVLVDPERRKSYILEQQYVVKQQVHSYHNPRTSYTASGATDFGRYTSYKTRANYYSDHVGYDEPRLEDRESILRSRKSFERTWNEAIHAAMHGTIESDILQEMTIIPEQIETEELKEWSPTNNNNVIMHLVYGRTVLGKIIHGSLGSSSSITTTFTSNESVNKNSNPNGDEDMLQLYFQNQLYATCKRYFKPTSDPDSNKSELDSVFEFESKVDLHGNILDSLQPFGRAVLFPPTFFHKSRDGFLFDKDNKIIYRLKTFKQPGVDNFHVFHAEERYLEFLCTRAWLPDSSLWLFPPRDSLYDSGGWYIQQNKHGQHSRFRRKHVHDGIHIPQVLDPSIPLLLCAFKSLDRMRKP